MGEREGGSKLLVRVFTHPACSGCRRAVEEAWNLSQAHPDIEIRTVRLEEKEGLDEAHSEGIRTIPTVILGSADGEVERWIGTLAPGALEAALETSAPA